MTKLFSTEQWKDIQGYEGHYKISTLGRIMSQKAGHKNKIMKQYKQANGYMQVCLWLDNKKKNHLVHRLVAVAFIPNPENLPDVNHIDEQKTNNTSKNLQWLSRSANVNYGVGNEKRSNAMKGRIPSNQRLARNDACFILEQKKRGKRPTEIRELMGGRLSLSIISHFYYGRSNQRLEG